MNKKVRDYLKIQYKAYVLELAKVLGNTRKVCRENKVSRSTFYNWKKKYDKEGQEGLFRKKSIGNNHPRRLSDATVEKVLELRKAYCKLPQQVFD